MVEDTETQLRASFSDYSGLICSHRLTHTGGTHETCPNRQGNCPHPSSPVPWTLGPNAPFRQHPHPSHTSIPLPEPALGSKKGFERPLLAGGSEARTTTGEGGSAVPSHLDVPEPGILPSDGDRLAGAITSLPWPGWGITDSQREARG